MFNVNDGNTFVNSIVHRPALDVVTGALFVLGLILLLSRRRFLDLVAGRGHRDFDPALGVVPRLPGRESHVEPRRGRARFPSSSSWG